MAEKDDCSFINGMAECFWAHAWADHCEEAGCYSLSGCQIEHHMPDIPELAYRLAHRVLGRIEERTGYGVASLFRLAMLADNDGKEVDYDPELAFRFGECLAYAAKGDGVSWFDDHKSFPELEDADLHGCEDCGGVSVDLQEYAADHCEHCEDDDGGMSDEQERAHERKQMGIT